MNLSNTINMTQQFYMEFYCKTCGISDFDLEFMLIHIFHDHDEHVERNENLYIQKSIIA